MVAVYSGNRVAEKNKITMGLPTPRFPILYDAEGY